MKKIVQNNIPNVISVEDVLRQNSVGIIVLKNLKSYWVLLPEKEGNLWGFTPITHYDRSRLYPFTSRNECMTEALKNQELLYHFDDIKDFAKAIVENNFK